ncbi:hypothetical protein IAU60_003635 [Kwoniella sp. DSM 27419]
MTSKMPSPSPVFSELPPGSDIDVILWNMLEKTYIDMRWYNAVSTIFIAIVVTSILSFSVRYFEHFLHTDSTWMLYAVGLGAMGSLTTLALTTAQQYFLVYCNLDNIHTTFRRLYLIDMTVLLIGTLFNLAAGAYYTYRAWRMSKNKWWVIPIFSAALIAQFVVGIVAIHHGYQLPRITVDNFAEFDEFTFGNAKLFTLFRAMNLAVDGSLCLVMTVVLLKSKQSIFHNQSRLFTKLLAATYETMLPPAICLLVLEIFSSREQDPLVDFRRPICLCLPVLYWHSTILTLVGRQKVRQLLDRQLVADGIEVYHASSSMSAGDRRPSNRVSIPPPKGSGGRVFISRGRDKAVDIELDPSFTRSAGSFVRIETEQNVSYDPVNELSPVTLMFDRPSVNRGPSPTSVSPFAFHLQDGNADADVDVKPDDSITHSIGETQSGKWESMENLCPPSPRKV